MMSSPIVLILGSGVRVGQSSAQAFAAAGYRVAIASRSLNHLHINSSGFFELKMDLSKPEEIASTFAAVEASFGAPPSVVIHNGASCTVLYKDDPLSQVNFAELTSELNTNYVSSIFAAKHAVAGFARLPETASKTYIQTGNLLNIFANPTMLTFGAGKAAAAHFIEGLTKAYNPKGYRFYFADQRYENGASPLNGIDGDVHGELYVELAGDRTQRDADYTFVKGLGYKALKPEDAGNTNW